MGLFYLLTDTRIFNMNNHDLKFYFFMLILTIMYMAWKSHEITQETLELLGK